MAFVGTANVLLHALKKENHTPERFEVLFGEGAMEGLSRERLRTITSITALLGLPVSFPEEPGPRFSIIEIKCCSESGGGQVGVAVELVEDSYDVEV